MSSLNCNYSLSEPLIKTHLAGDRLFIAGAKLETLHKKKLHQFKILYFFQRRWAFNYKQKARNLVVLCTISKSG